MSNHIDFYFDIISPYTFIAHKKIQKIKDNQNIIFNYKPILLGGLHNLAGITAPAFNKYKIKNMQNDCEMVSKKNKILVAIPLIITYLIGPIGLFFYWIIRIFFAKRINLYE